MKFLALSKFLLIIILPFLLFLLVLSFTGFSDSFYRGEFSRHNVLKDVPQAASLNEKVMNFINGKSSELPKEFNEREKQHLWDVKNIIKISKILLYALVILFFALLAVSFSILKISNHITNFAGKILVFGGFLTVMLAALLFFIISSDFSSAFGSFHRLFFQKETYLFDPANEIIVSLYPEQLFMDLGTRISKFVIAASIVITLLGMLLLFKSKNKKNK